MGNINWIRGTSGSAELIVGDLNATHPDVMNRPLKEVLEASLYDTGSSFDGFAHLSHTQSADTITDGTFNGNYIFQNDLNLSSSIILNAPGEVSGMSSISGADDIILNINNGITFNGSQCGIEIRTFDGSIISGSAGSGYILLGPMASQSVYITNRLAVGTQDTDTLIPFNTTLFVTGAVGINTMFPSNSLDVSGSAIIRGGLTASSAQISTLVGTSSVATKSVSASFAITASAATSITFPIVSSSYALTASYATLAQNVLSGNVSSSFATTASAATSITFTPISASHANNADIAITVIGKGSGSFTGSFTGSLLGNASTATTASAATTITFPIVSSSFATTASYAINAATASISSTSTLAANAVFALSASVAATASVLLGSITSASYALTASFAANASAPISVSFATTASAATSITFPIVSSSFATTASYAIIAQNLLGSITSASYALTASFAANAGNGGNPNASQVQPGTYPSGAFIYSGSLTITGSVYSRLNVIGVTGSHTASESEQFIVVDAGTATSSVYLPTVSGRLGAVLTIRKADTGSFPVIIIPSGSETIDYSPSRVLISKTDSATMVAGLGLWMSDGFNSSSIIPSASYAVTASFALNASGGGSSVSASYALTSSYASLAQNVLGSITSASFATTSSFATSASVAVNSKSSSFAINSLTANSATTVTGPINNNLIISGNLSISGSIIANVNMKVITGSYSASINDQYLIGNAASANCLIYLPTSSLGVIEMVLIRKENTAANTMTVHSIGSDNIGYAGSGSLTVTQLTPLDVVSDQNGTWIISSYA